MEYLKPKPNSVVRVADTPSPTHDNNNITSQRMLDVGNEALSSLKFLLRMARNFEDQGNLHESIKSAESALILRKVREKEIEAVMEGREEIIISASSSRANTPRKPNTAAHARPESPPMIVPGSVREQAKELVLRCNSYAVSELNKKHFESSNFFLNKALFLTDNGAKKTPGDASRSIKKVMALTAASPAELAAAVANTPEEEALTVGCFAGFEEDRLRLRASTYNNLGCMDRRRGKLAECLDHLRQAIHIEVRLDPSTAGSASTYLNLCTVLNEMQRHGEAVVACERAIAALQLSILEQPEEEQLARTATMLVVGLYNLGVSLERRARPHDDDAAHKAYQQALDVARRYLFGPSCGSVEEALDQIKRMTEPRLYQAPPPPDPAEVAAAVAAIARANATPLSEIHALEATTPGLHSDDGASPPMPSHTRGSPLDASSRMSAADSGAPKSCDDDGNGAAAPPTQPPTQELFVRSLPVLPTMAALKRGSGAAMSSTTEHSGHIHTPMSAGNPPQHASTFSGFSISQPNTTRSAGASSTGHHQQQHVPTTTATGQELLSFHSSNSSNMAQRRPLQLAPLHSQSIGDASSSSAAPLARQLRHDGAETLNTRSSSSVHLASFQQGGGSTTNLAAPPPPPGRRVSMSTRGSISAPPVVNEKNPFGRRTFGSTSSISTTPSRLPPLGNSPSASITSAMSKQSPQAAALEEKRKAAARSKRLQEKVRHNTRRRQEKEVAEQDGAMAEVMYEQMLQGMREGELRRCYNAATQIQRVWRGVMARSLIRSMMQSVVVLQRVVRRHLTKVWEERRRAEEERQRLMAERQRLQLQSARKIQARVRQFLRRVQIRREYLARQSRSFYAARVIQRGYRAACQRRRENLAALAEAQRREDEQRAFRERVAARRIQLAYHQYRGRRVEFAAIQEKQRRSRAATAIQALVRGVLARAWFRYYRAYRRDQELRSAVNVRRLVLMQSAMRAVQSYQLCREKEVAQLIAKANLRLFQAATKIQTMWRQHVAFIHLERLRADKARLDRQAIILQRWLRMCVIRSEYIRRRDARRREAAAITIQVWVRARWQHAKEKAFAEYHAKLLKAQQLERLRQSGSRVVQACCLAKRSALIVGSMMKTYQKHEKAACVWQRVARGYDGRREVALDLKATRLMRQQEREHMFRTVAARVIQRAWRCAMAKDTVERMRREAAAAAIIARSYRIYRAKMELHALRDARLAKQQEVCARKIQRIVRAYLIKRKAREMDAYYRAQHIRKMERQRREEVATIIQALWRGYTTRKAVQQEVEALHGLASYAVKIQRAWRNHFLRCNMKEELLVRGEERQERSKAVLKLQCFWRKMAAAERVARLRETNAQRQHSAVVLQCWWRGVLARRVRAALLRARDEEERVALFYASKWEKAVGIVNAFLRARRCQLERVENIRLSLLSELTYEQQEVFKVRHSAATRIQAMYRGHYERVYVRGVRRERAAEHLLHTALAKKQQRAALRLQCAYRSHVARKEVGSRMAERRAQVLATHEKLVETADTRDVVKELFWVHAATDLRNNAATRLAKIQQQQDAVRRIITCYRGWCARRRTTDDRLIRRRDRAAKIIQEHWKQYIAITTIKAEQRKQQAALEIQRRVRGWLVRKNWAHWRHQMEADRRMHVMADDVYDGAATRLQSFWRRVSARRHTQRLRESRQQQKELEACNEAATVIQEAFRTHYAENSPRPDN